MKAKLRIVALVLGAASSCGASGVVSPAAAELVPGGWLQSPSHIPEPEIPAPMMRPPSAPPTPPAPVSAPRKAPHRTAQPPRMRTPSQPPSDGQVHF